jgi:hypothetical protein
VVPPGTATHEKVIEREEEFMAGLGVMFWILIGALLLAVVGRYL